MRSTWGDRNFGQFPSLRSGDITCRWRFRVLLSVSRSAELGADSREKALEVGFPGLFCF